jgi:uncharacterized coiled-coil DUF342 family protein
MREVAQLKAEAQE